MLVALSLIGGCASSAALRPAGPEASPAVALAADSMKVDKVSTGQVVPDGASDGALSLSFEGPAIAIALISVDAAGQAEAGGEVWDTYVGEQLVPQVVGASLTGSSTWQLGVFDGSAVGTTNIGALTPLGAGHHQLSPYASDSGLLGHGRLYRVLIERPDHTFAKSNVFPF